MESIGQLSNTVSITLAVILAIAGAAHCYSPAGLAKLYPKRAYAQIPHAVRGAMRILAAIFLVIPQMRIWGGTLAAVTLFFAVITLLRDARYAWAVPGMMVMAAIPITMIAPSSP